MKVLAVIGARLNSSRLPAKHLLQLAGYPLIERLQQRLLHCQTIDEIALATTADLYNRPLVEWAENRMLCQPFRGDVNDLMGRINEVVKSQNADIIVYICGDCPLVDPEFIDHAVTQLKIHPDVDSIELKPNIKSLHEGMHFYSRIGWDKLLSSSLTAMEREHVGYANKNKPCLSVFLIDDVDDYSLAQHRISVDTVADYKFMQTIYQYWYKEQPIDSIVSLKWVQQQLLNHPSFSSINAHVIQKRPDQEYKKISLYCHVSESIGMGHLKRCALIATTIQEYFGFGTILHIWGQVRELPWLTSQVIWYDKSETFLDSMRDNQDAGWILDFHPDYIDMDKLLEICTIFKRVQHRYIIALDKLSGLLAVADKLFIPSFYTEVVSEKLSVGWENYILPERLYVTKQKRVLVLTGGSDALGFGQNLPNLLEKSIPQDWFVEWVQGPYAKRPNIPQNSPQWCLTYNPENIQELISGSQIVISCYGLSLVESLQVGAAVLLLPVHQLCSAKELAALKSFNCCLIADQLEDIPLLLKQLFSENQSIAAYQKTAEDLLSSANGAQIVGKMVQDLMIFQSEQA